MRERVRKAAQGEMRGCGTLAFTSEESLTVALIMCCGQTEGQVGAQHWAGKTHGMEIAPCLTELQKHH